MTLGMTRTLAALALLALAACGADGEPVKPHAGLGVSVGDSGVHAGANVGVRSGPFTINLGIF